ncbi:MAG TPA: phage major capsid protein [Chitinophagaceae bacterium]|nr:phage major capsid protein [Chitinophagaceae bacterium]
MTEEEKKALEEKGLNDQVKEIAEGVKGFKAKAEANEKTLGEIKTSQEETANEVKGLNDWKVKKDETDQKNQEALDNLIAGKGKEVQPEVKSFARQLSEGIRTNFEAIKGLKKGQTVGMEIDVLTGLKKSIENGYDTKAAADMTFANNFSTADNSITQVRSGILALPNRKVHIRQLLPLGTLGKSDFAYVKEASTGEGDPAAWNTAAGAKTQFDIDLTEATAPSEYIAGFVVITRKMLDDVDSLASFLQMRLLEKYYKAEDAQILTGNGTAPNLSGLITNATASESTATNDWDQILDDLGQLEDTDYDATGILIKPSAYYKMVQTKASTSGVYDQPSIVTMVNGQLYFNGIPVYKSTAINKSNYLLGDFEKGAQLLIRENPRVEFFEQDSTNVRNNKITVRIEGRVALPIYYSGAFITGTLASY